MVKVLWYTASARKFSLFHDWREKVDFIDQLIVKNHMAHVAHQKATRFFFKHDYDYLLVTSDDILGTPYNARLLLEDLEKEQFPVLSGWTDAIEDGKAALTLKPVQGIKERKIRREGYEFIRRLDLYTGKYGFPFIKVWYTGLPFTAIRRDILKKVPLKPFMTTKDEFCVTTKAKQKGRGIMFDLQFSLSCAKKGIPITIDTRCFLLHFGKTKRCVRVGKDKPSTKLIKATAKV